MAYRDHIQGSLVCVYWDYSFFIILWGFVLYAKHFCWMYSLCLILPSLLPRTASDYFRWCKEIDTWSPFGLKKRQICLILPFWNGKPEIEYLAIFVLIPRPPGIWLRAASIYVLSWVRIARSTCYVCIIDLKIHSMQHLGFFEVQIGKSG